MSDEQRTSKTGVLLERLRSIYNFEHDETSAICDEAADTIERLTAERADLLGNHQRHVDRYVELVAERDRLRAALQNIVDSYGPSGYGSWDFVGIACNALEIPHPPVIPGQADDLVTQNRRLRAALENILGMSVEMGTDAGHAMIELAARAALAGAADETDEAPRDTSDDHGRCPACGALRHE